MKQSRQRVGTCILAAVVGSSFMLTSYSATPAGYAAVVRVMQDCLIRENVPGGAWGIIVDVRLWHDGVLGLRRLAQGSGVKNEWRFRQGV